MPADDPVTELDTRYSSEGATPTSWQDARRRLAEAEVYWLSTVKPDGRPHVVPLLSVWVDDAPYFCTGEDERKARNVAHNPHCVLSTGCDNLSRGLDVTVEGDAERVSDERLLRRIADAYVVKYGPEWYFEVREGAFHGEGGRALVFRVTPHQGFGFGRSEAASTEGERRQPGEGSYSQTRWDLASASR